MLEEILTQAEAHIQLIIALLLLFAVVLELIHVVQTRRMNKKISYAVRKLQKYLSTVFAETSDEEDDEQPVEPVEQAEQEQVVEQLEVEPSVQSRQEKDMRATLANKKLQQDEELLDTVLQEVFD